MGQLAEPSTTFISTGSQVGGVVGVAMNSVLFVNEHPEEKCSPTDSRTRSHPVGRINPPMSPPSARAQAAQGLYGRPRRCFDCGFRGSSGQGCVEVYALV